MLAAAYSLLWLRAVAESSLVRSVGACRNRGCVRLVHAVAAATCSHRDAGIVECHVVCLEDFFEFVRERVAMNFLTSSYDKFLNYELLGIL